MDTEFAVRLCTEVFGSNPENVTRYGTGIGNYVFAVEYAGAKYTVRMSAALGTYTETVTLLCELGNLDVPVPRVVCSGNFEGYEYLVLTHIEGKDLGDVYAELTDAEKRGIAHDVLRIQNLTAKIRIDVPEHFSWYTEFVDYMLTRAEQRIRANGYFDAAKVDILRGESMNLREYFDEVRPVPYLDDITTKNLLINNGAVSGVIDVDWIGIGDKLTFAALTNMALMNMEADTCYADYLLEAMDVTQIEQRAFLFYTLIYCVDFMGERGTRFTDKVIEVNSVIIERLNRIFDQLIGEWYKLNAEGEAYENI